MPSKSTSPGLTRLGWRRALRRAALLAIMVMQPLGAGAWGIEGHQIVAEAAQKLLTASARAEVDRLLALELGATLASVSTWADKFRSPSTAPWHFVNLPRDSNCTYDPDRSCVQGACVVGAIERQAEVLASRAADEDRLKALKYVVHFVADVHQPLHAGFADDRGGNSFQLQAFGRGTNLHALWDSALLQQWPGGFTALRAAVEADNTADSNPSPGRWAEASCRVVTTEGFYPDGHKLDDEYARRWGATLVQQLAAAARRLAMVLNQTLGAR